MYQIKRRWTNAKKCTYNNYLFDSKFEAGYCQELDLRVKAKDIKSYDRQKTLELIVNDFLVCTYRIDFIVYYFDGTVEYCEVKGWPTPVWRLKWKLFEALYGSLPNVKLTIIQQGKFRPPKARRIKK